MRFMYAPALGRFVRSVHFEGDEPVPQQELTADASLWAFAYLGMFAADDPRMVATMQAVQTSLTVAAEHSGVARFDGDTYQLRQTAVDLGVPGNPGRCARSGWRKYHLLTAETPADLEYPLQLIEQVAAAALPSGALAEQIDPASGEPGPARRR